MDTALVLIDPQNDFVALDGALSVPGAAADMDRLAAFVDAQGQAIDAIWVSLDMHQRHDISHPSWWLDAGGAYLAPFTQVTAAEVVAGTIRTAKPEAAERSLTYLQALEASGRYPHVIWPEHCLLGGPGSNVWPALYAALHAWERRTGRAIHYVLKGENPWSEHFSAVRAEVPDPMDPATTTAMALVDAVRSARRILVAGEARSHCVASTVRDLCETIGDALAERLVLLTDATSDVPGFQANGDVFVKALTQKGMKLATTTSDL